MHQRSTAAWNRLQQIVAVCRFITGDIIPRPPSQSRNFPIVKNHLKTATEAAKEAGKILLSYFKADYEIRDKGFRNPVTTADFASNTYLEEVLRDTYPEYGWLSEETIDSTDRLSKERVWVVDPLDGTKEFIEGVPHFVVSIGLVEGIRPILGVLYNPISGELFAAAQGVGATCNGVPASISQTTTLEQSEILNSRSETRRGLWRRFDKHFMNLRPVGSVAYKLGLVSAGKSDLFATLRPKNEWDVCAGDAILHEAGATMRCLNGNQVKYNQKNVLIKPGLVAGNNTLVQSFLDLHSRVG